MDTKILNSLALQYHSQYPKGKIATQITKTLNTQQDLAIAYSPGVAEPCRLIHEDQQKVFEYTARGNLVAVITNGTAVLGLGDIGPYAAKPVMEGKAMLFKKYANIDVFDIELNANDPDLFVQTVKALEPTFGGINLEDIKAPECFYIEEKLRAEMSIPVFHDDQHGTAIVASAAFINALEITKRTIAETKVVINGAGAAAIAIGKLLLHLGLNPRHLIMCDSIGVIYQGRSHRMNPYKQQFAIDTNKRTLEDALSGADAFIGVSVADSLEPTLLKKMNPAPLIFAMANPDPEIKPETAREVCPDSIIVTGRSDYPNQVNNVLCFPYIFRGALDTQASQISTAMKIAAIKTLSELAKLPVPDSVKSFYGKDECFEFSKDYLIPKPNDPRLFESISKAVAQAAIDSGVARIKTK